MSLGEFLLEHSLKYKRFIFEWQVYDINWRCSHNDIANPSVPKVSSFNEYAFYNHCLNDIEEFSLELDSQFKISILALQAYHDHVNWSCSHGETAKL